MIEIDTITSDIQAIQSRVDASARDELATLLQAWFDKHQPEAKRDFAITHMPTVLSNCAHICGHAFDWFAFGN